MKLWDKIMENVFLKMNEAVVEWYGGLASGIQVLLLPIYLTYGIVFIFGIVLPYVLVCYVCALFYGLTLRELWESAKQGVIEGWNSRSNV